MKLTFWKTIQKGIVGLAIFMLSLFLVALTWHTQLGHEQEDCDAVYQAVVRRHRNDGGWMKTHVVLNRTDSFRSIASGVRDMQAGLHGVKRIRYWWEFHSFLAQRDGEILAYSGVSEPRLRVISQSERSLFIEKGITILTFTRPGFSFDRRHAVVFVGAEHPSAWFDGALIYFKKVGGRWIEDRSDVTVELVLTT